MLGHHVHDEMYFLLALVRAVRTLKLGLLPALPPPVVVQRALTLVRPSAIATNKRARI